MNKAEIGRFLGLKVSRRDFLKLTGAGLLTAIGLGKVSLHTPSKDSTGSPDRQKEFSVFPGWIEANVNAPFIQLDKGHFYFMHDAIFKNPMVLELTKDFFGYLKKNFDKKTKVGLGESLSFVIEMAQKKLKHPDLKIAPETNISLEAVHAALFAFAAGFTAQWFTKEELEQFGLSLEGYSSMNHFFWAEGGFGKVVFPKLFGVEKEEPKGPAAAKVKYSGEDRAIHFAHHLLIGFEYLYSKNQGLREHEYMPNIIKALVFLERNGSSEGEVRALSKWLGYLYEVLGLRNFENWPVFGKTVEQINEGTFDDMVEADYKGNALGVEAAIVLWRLLMLGKSLKPVFAELKDERFSRFETEPELRNSFPK